MQDTSNMLTRWAIALRSFDFTVRHKPGRLHVVPDTLSRLFAFDHQQQLDAPQLAPICRNVPEDPALHSNVPRRPYQVSADRLDNLQPVQSDRELFAEKSVNISATNVFETINRDILRKKQALEYGTYVDYLTKQDAPLPDNESTTSMSYYFMRDGLMFKSYFTTHITITFCLEAT